MRISGYGLETIHLEEELSLSGGEAIGLFIWLEEADYIRPEWRYGKRRREEGSGTLDCLTERGYELLGELPDPQERLILGLEAASRAIARDPNLSPDEKGRRIDWLEEGKFWPEPSRWRSPKLY
jgi:hypothetical protein